MARCFIWLFGCALLSLLLISPATADPKAVFFPSADGATDIVAYLFAPAGDGPHPAIVMLHGRSGPYSSNVNATCTLVSRSEPSPCNAAGLSKRHMMWGQYWAEHGYLALLPDSFGPRGKAHGFGRRTHGDPERDDVNERTVRPLDAEGALSYLRGRKDVDHGRIFLQGWSNGASTALNVMARQGQQTGYRAALVFYPGCGKASLLGPALSTAAPITMFLASDDEEVSPSNCVRVADRSRDSGTRIEVVTYQGATHDFDEPSKSRQSVAGNRAALADVLTRALDAVEAARN
jgi:carboxymethylenebutenolidase